MASGCACRICWSLLTVIVLAVGALAYRLLSGGHTQVARYRLAADIPGPAHGPAGH